VSDPRRFRDVLGQYPTGVCVVTATQADGRRAGFVVGSFTSVSLDPPLVGFFPDKGSSSWPKIERARSFCINVLSASQ
jgi:3-hydroxy-9,10-secoandrosta-1,3,5(10)-triene-9,17-dione monooxygenase reductase component